MRSRQELDGPNINIDGFHRDTSRYRGSSRGDTEQDEYDVRLESARNLTSRNDQSRNYNPSTSRYEYSRYTSRDQHDTKRRARSEVQVLSIYIC